MSYSTNRQTDIHSVGDMEERRKSTSPFPR